LVNWIRRLLGREDLRVAYHVISRQRSLQSAGETDVLRNLCQQLMQFRGDAEPPPSERVDLQLEFVQKLTNHTWHLPLVVVIDGLDEAEGWTPNTKYHVPKDLPDNVFFVVSARPIAKINWSTELELPPHDTLELDALSEDDIALLLRAVGGTAASLADDKKYVAELRAKSDGDPLFLRFAAIPEIIAGKYANMEALGAIPHGLEAYLEKWWEEIEEPVGTKESVRELIGYWRSRGVRSLARILSSST
jgi:hypothetical protein